MKNIERIKNLNTWDFAEFVNAVSNGATKITNCTDECSKCDYSKSYCTYLIAEWLNEEGEENA